VRGLAELHGGAAWMESEFGKGCSVFVTLPVKQQAAVEAADPYTWPKEKARLSSRLFLSSLNRLRPNSTS
jgi:hypothetical protein